MGTTKRETQRLRTISKMADKKQRLVYSILEFLQASMDDGTIKQDDKEGIEVAIQCIGEAFSVDMADEGQKSQLSVKPANLQQIFDVYLKTKAKSGASASTPATATDAYEKGLELEPANASMKGSLVTARARAGESSDADADDGSVTSPSQQSRSPPANNPFAGLAGL